MKFTGRNVNLSSKAMLGAAVRIGDESTVYDHVQIGSRTIIANHCVLGEPLNGYYHHEEYENPPLVIGTDVLFRSHCLVYAGSQIGDGVSTGHRVIIREHTRIGNNSRIGTNCDVQDRVTIGNYCWLHSGIFLPAYTVLEDFVFIYPHVIFTNDPMPPSADLKGVVVESFAQVGAGAVLLPGVRIGQGSLIAAGAVVTRDVEPFSLMAGNPARKIKDVREMKYGESNELYYPWMRRFSRGMPWEETGWDAWQEARQ